MVFRCFVGIFIGSKQQNGLKLKTVMFIKKTIKSNLLKHSLFKYTCCSVEPRNNKMNLDRIMQ